VRLNGLPVGSRGFGHAAVEASGTWCWLCCGLSPLECLACLSSLSLHEIVPSAGSPIVGRMPSSNIASWSRNDDSEDLRLLTLTFYKGLDGGRLIFIDGCIEIRSILHGLG
jgi:hypothetical protein